MLLFPNRATRCRLSPSALNRAFHRCRFNQLRIRGHSNTITTTTANTAIDTPDDACDRINRRICLRHCTTLVGSDATRADTADARSGSDEKADMSVSIVDDAVAAVEAAVEGLVVVVRLLDGPSVA